MAEIQKSATATILATASATGIALHLFFFKHISDEYDGVFWRLFVSSLTWWCLVISLFSSVLLYRAFFHPLKRFPGPFNARLSKFWSLKQVVDSKLRWWKILDQLHEQYGDYVRTGPRELVIFDPAALIPVLGSGSITGKGPFYDSLETSVSTTRDKEFHRKRRKIWDNAFKKSLSDYGPQIEEFTSQFLDRIGKSNGNPILLNDICIHYSYDVMSALAFGDPMGFVKGESNEAATSVLDNMQRGIDAIGLLLHIPWLMGILTTFSWAIGPTRLWTKYSTHLVSLRKQKKNPKPDLFGHLIDNTEDTATGRALLNADCRVIISAGSETTATALTFLFVQLALHPEWVQHLREEMDPIFATSNYECTRTYPVLDAVINESIRLHPAVFFGSQRETPPQGMRIGETYIPGNTIISIPSYQLGRDERNFVRANDFLPERWYSKPELIINKTAHMPFLIGPFNCAGRNLAMMELRSVVARVVHEFDVSFPKGVEFHAVDYFDRVKDYFVAGAPKQEIVFMKRK